MEWENSLNSFTNWLIFSLERENISFKNSRREISEGNENNCRRSGERFGGRLDEDDIINEFKIKSIETRENKMKWKNKLENCEKKKNPRRKKNSAKDEGNFIISFVMK